MSPTFGKKKIFVDGERVDSAESAVTMWASYDFNIGDYPAQIRFRTIKYLKGVSCCVDGEKLDPGDKTEEPSAEFLGSLMIGLAVFLFFALIGGGAGA